MAKGGRTVNSDWSLPGLVATLSGRLVEIKTGPCEQTTGPALVGTHLLVKNKKGETLNVHLGPEAAVGGPNYIVAGRYEDRLARTDVGWRITHRTLTVMWTEGNVAVAHPG